MSVVPKIVYFDRWMDPVGPKHVSEKNPHIEIMKLDSNINSSSIWKEFEMAHGYQMLPSAETDEKFYPTQNFIERCPNLLCVSSSGAGYDQVDVSACSSSGILVINQSGTNAESVAQHTLGMMLVLCKQIIQSDRAIRSQSRKWDRWTYMGHELTGRTIGLVGLGNIGRRVAEICYSLFSMNVLAYDPYLDDQEFAARNSKKATLSQVMAESDIVSIHCPLSEETTGMIGVEQIEMMKFGAIFISTARGGIHDEVAVEKALANGYLLGAGLDVFSDEPPSNDHPILKYPNTIVSPHNAGITSDCLFNMAQSAARQWLQVFNQEKPTLLINPEAWDLYCQKFENIFAKNGA